MRFIVTAAALGMALIVAAPAAQAQENTRLFCDGQIRAHLMPGIEGSNAVYRLGLSLTSGFVARRVSYSIAVAPPLTALPPGQTQVNAGAATYVPVAQMPIGQARRPLAELLAAVSVTCL